MCYKYLYVLYKCITSLVHPMAFPRLEQQPVYVAVILMASVEPTDSLSSFSEAAVAVSTQLPQGYALKLLISLSILTPSSFVFLTPACPPPLSACLTHQRPVIPFILINNVE